MNLNLGSGTNRKQGYISVDKYCPEADEHWDIASHLPLDDESVDNIYACHVIEHLSRAEWDFASKEWMRVLKRGGRLEILCPDIVKVCKKFIKDPSNSFLMMQLYGLQSNEGEYHKNGFNERTLAESFPDLTGYILPATDDTELHMRFTKDV